MEFLDVVNEKDEVVGKESRPDVYKNSLRHRIVHVFIFNDTGELALQLRSATAAYRPNHWGSTAAGHVQSGETYEHAAARELEEEAGITTALEYVDTYSYEAEGFKKFLALFRGVWNKELKSTSEEGSEIQFIPITEIKAREQQEMLLMPETLFILKKLYGTDR